LENAIIQTFPNLIAPLQMKIIIRRVRKDLPRFSEDTIKKRIVKLMNQGYLIKKSKGIYALSPDYDFELENKLSLIAGSQIDIPDEIRIEHSKALRYAIFDWIKYFPEPPLFLNSDEFIKSVIACEKHPIFNDLCTNHVPDLCSKWNRYKHQVQKLDKSKLDLEKSIEKAVSKIFSGIELNFVEYRKHLNDYDCCLPLLTYNTAIEYEFGSKIKSTGDECIDEFGEDEEISQNEYTKEYYNNLYRISEMTIFEKDGSLIFGEKDFGNIECIRVPKKDEKILSEGSKKIYPLMSDFDSEIYQKADEITKLFMKLQEDRNEILNELRRLSHYQVFEGNCEYVGAE
jgi:hypothetical protein